MKTKSIFKSKSFWGVAGVLAAWKGVDITGLQEAVGELEQTVAGLAAAVFSIYGILASTTRKTLTGK